MFHFSRRRTFVLSGVKNADENELRTIATDPDEIHMYNVQDFKFMVDVVDDLTLNLCNSVKGPGGRRESVSSSPLSEEKSFRFLLLNFRSSHI